MLYAVKPFKAEYQGELPADVGEFPIVSLELPDGAGLADLPGPEWCLETEADRMARLAITLPAYEMWQASQLAE